MELNEYQAQARLTDLDVNTGPGSLMIPILGLVGEAGSVATAYKKYLRDGLSLDENHSSIARELGDTLWYLAVIAKRCGLSLDQIASDNLDRVVDRYGVTDTKSDVLASLPRLDEAYEIGERFPDLLVIRFGQQNRADGKPVVSMFLEHAEPALYSTNMSEKQSDVAEKISSQLSLRDEIGDALTDNAVQADDYRFHDAFHLGFLTVLGWSPVLRSLMRLKRKSNPVVDESQDGARAVDVEEGITSLLRQVAEHHGEFQSEAQVDNDTLDVIAEHVRGLEVSQLPTWLWRDAITQGFQAWKQLAANHGGYLICDLKGRKLTYAKTWMALE